MQIGHDFTVQFTLHECKKLYTTKFDDVILITYDKTPVYSVMWYFFWTRVVQ